LGTEEVYENGEAIDVEGIGYFYIETKEKIREEE
jgi:hypothetical protein